jgi:hypothetical protein
MAKSSYGFADELMKSFEAFFEEWNVILAHHFRWSYTGEGLCGKTIKRFTEILKWPSSKLKISSLAKQLRLTKNLLDQYFSDVPHEYWERCFAVFRANEETLQNTIDNELGPRKKENVEKGFKFLSKTANDYLWEIQLATV